MLIEFCIDENSGPGKASLSYDDVAVSHVTKSMDASNKNTIEQLHKVVKEFPGISIQGSLTCTVWSAWQV